MSILRRASFAFLLAAWLTPAEAAAQDPAPAKSAKKEDPDSAPSATAESQASMKTEKQDPSAKEPVAVAKPDEPAPPPEPQKEVGEDATYGHGMQFGLRAGVVFGYKMDFRYEGSPFCRAFDPSKAVDSQQKVCGFGAAPAAEIALSFAPLDAVEPYIFGRFGFSGEKATNTNALQLYGVGARIYTMSDSRFKIFIEPALAFEAEGGAGNIDWSYNHPTYKKDLIFHVGVGPQYDFAKAFGAYVNAGLDVGVLRSISATLLIHIGLQLRIP